MDDLNIRHLKLSNGDDVIALVSVKNDDSFVVERPVLVHMNMMGGFQFIPWMPFSDAKSFKINKSQIVSHVNIAPDVAEAYIQFALKLKDFKRQLEPKTDMDILRDLEERLVSSYEEVNPDFEIMDRNTKKRTVH